MGDCRRFHEFSGLVLKQFPHASTLPIADVAGGKGFLRTALHERGVNQVTTWDKCRSMPRRSNGYKYKWFDYKTAPDDYGLVLGMHPDEGTDHVIKFAARHKIPFAVCPCCVKPSAAAYHGIKEYQPWCRHLAALAQGLGMKVDVFDLRMRGCSTVIVGRP